MTKQTYPLLGLHCTACASHATKALEEVPGVVSASVNLSSATAFVVYDEAVCHPEALRSAVASMGYELRIDEVSPETIEAIRLREERLQLYKAIVATVLSLVVMVLMMVHPITLAKAVISALLTLVVLIWAGSGFYARGWKQLKSKAAGMDLLVALSTGTAMLYSLTHLMEYLLSGSIHHLHHLYFEAAAMTIAFVLLGKVIEARAQRRTTTALRHLMGSQPKQVIQVLPTGEVTLPIEEVEPGMILRAQPGALFAVDGEVVSGESYANEQLISGEPIPVPKTQGAPIYAGTMNGNGSLTYRATEVGRGTVMARIIRLVQEAQSSRAPIQKLVDRIARIFVPVIVFIALITWVLWLVLLPHGGLEQGLIAAVTVLIIACPCALGLATPTAIMVGIGRGASEGILIRNAESLEAARHIDTIVLDKTGTITEGRPEVKTIHWLSGSSKADHLRLSRLEQLSAHPLASAVVQALNIPFNPLQVMEFSEVAGKGLQGKIGEKVYRVGSTKFIMDSGITLGEQARKALEEGEVKGATCSLYASEEEVLAVIMISDTIRPSAREAINHLRQRGINIIMLTGDGERAAQAIAQEVGGIQYIAGVLPEGKAEHIRSLQAQGARVAMVGDGINDAAALALADVSIAMGQGSDLAMETAMVTIRTSNLLAIDRLLSLSHRTLRVIHQNLFWACIYNLVAIPIAAGILYPISGYLMNPMLAGGLMMLSSLSVVTNSVVSWGRREDKS